MSFILALGPSLEAQEAAKDNKAIEVIDKCIETLGGNAFREVKDITSSGKYYQLRKGQTSLPIMYQDYTKLPDKSRYEEGGKKYRDIFVFNLEAGKGWIADIQKGVREATKEELDHFRKTVKHAFENVLRTRYKEPKTKLYYYGPNDVSGKRKSEAVELVDEENDSVIVYFDFNTHYPLKIEYTEVDKEGRKLKIEEEFSNWHNVQAVMTPFRIDTYTEGETLAQRFVEKLSYNTNLPESLFTKPQIQIKPSKKRRSG